MIEVSSCEHEYIQVKSGYVSRDCWVKVIGNWILTNDLNAGKFSLLCEKPLSFKCIGEESVEAVYKYFEKGESKNKKSIAKKVNEMLFKKNNENEIKEIIRRISSKCVIKV